MSTGHANDRLQDVAFGALLVVSLLEPRSIFRGLDDTVRWGILGSGFVAAFLLSLAVLQPWSPHPGDGFRRSVLWDRPVSFLIGSVVWTLAISPFGLKPPSDLVMAFGLLAFVIYGAWYVERRGWIAVEQVLWPVLWTLVIINGAAIVLTGQLGERAMGASGSFNGLANVAALSAFVGVVRWSQGDRRGVVLLGAGLLLLVLSDGRVSQLSLLLAVVVASRGRLPKWAALVPAVVLFAGAGFAMWAQSEEAIAEAVSRSGQTDEIVTVTGRTPLWRTAIEGIESEPVTGFGAASTSEFFATVDSESAREIEFEVNDAHNLVLQTALNGGIPAAMLLVASICSFGARARRSVVPIRDGVVVIILVHGLTEHVVREPDGLLVLLAAALASSVAVPNAKRREAQRLLVSVSH